MRNVIIAAVIFIVLVGFLAIVFGARRASTAQNGLASVDQLGAVQTLPPPSMVPPQEYITVPTAYYIGSVPTTQAAATQTGATTNTANSASAGGASNQTVWYHRSVNGTYVAYNPNDPSTSNFPTASTRPGTVTYASYPTYPSVPNVPALPPATTRHYVYSDSNSCRAVVFSCSNGETLFNDASGCGCEQVRPVRRYLQRDPNVCSIVRFQCERNESPFSDSSGCGCESAF